MIKCHSQIWVKKMQKPHQTIKRKKDGYCGRQNINDTCFCVSLPGRLTKHPLAVPLHYHRTIIVPAPLTPSPKPVPPPLLLNLWPIYTQETRRNLLKLHRPLQHEITVRKSPITHGRSDLQPLHLFFDRYKSGKTRLQ